MTSKTSVDGVLLLYHRPVLTTDAATVTEHINAFQHYSRCNIWSLNTQCGFPAGLAKYRFQAVVLHYSLFGGWYYYLTEPFLEYLSNCLDTYKVVFLQDEYRYCRKRFEFLNQYAIDCVYTLVEPSYFDQTYRKFTRVPTLVSHLPGYVCDDLITAAGRYALAPDKRTIDVGYRGRKLEFYMGIGAQEKCAIAEGFVARAAGRQLVCDIGCEETQRIYGEAWYRFLGNCRAVLGVEAGTSIFDLDDSVRTSCEALIAEFPGITFQDVHDRLLAPWEGRIPYRTISPRHFEAAALKSCQILFEGAYSGIMKPLVHYLPLKKDFSNFDEVVRLFRDETVRTRIAEQAFEDLIASQRYSYRTFIRQFEDTLKEAGLCLGAKRENHAVSRVISRGLRVRKLRAAMVEARFLEYVPKWLRRLAKPMFARWWHRAFGFNCR